MIPQHPLPPRTQPQPPRTVFTRRQRVSDERMKPPRAPWQLGPPDRPRPHAVPCGPEVGTLRPPLRDGGESSLGHRATTRDPASRGNHPYKKSRRKTKPEEGEKKRISARRSPTESETLALPAPFLVRAAAGDSGLERERERATPLARPGAGLV